MGEVEYVPGGEEEGGYKEMAELQCQKLKGL